MPTKKVEQFIGPAMKIDDVFRVAELNILAEDWAQKPHVFEMVQLNRYRELCDYYDVDPAVLLYSVQNRVSRTNATEQTGVFPQVGDLSDVQQTG